MTNSGRDELNEFLEKPLEITGGLLSTQNNLSATSLSSGGIDGLLIIKKTGKIVVEGDTVRQGIIGVLE